MTPQQAKLAAWTVVIVVVLFLWNQRAKSQRLDSYAQQTGELLSSGSFLR